jgi:23S rRNA (cytidine1920-2'-O)/16S rRNA (cytidine1409-2'-O)-methyltransferase
MSKSPGKRRIDVALVEEGFAQSRERAKALILAGKVLVDDQPVTKAGAEIPATGKIRVKGEDHPYVSRGALKLVHALKTFGIQVSGKIAADIGASTGGFTEVLLQEGAQRVYAIDVGHNQLDWKIRQNPQVVVLEKTNARFLTKDSLPEPVDLIVVDVSFISLEKIAPALLEVSRPGAQWITLIKPQFEVGPEKVGKGGIVLEEEYRREAVDDVTRALESLGAKRLGLIDSPITGAQGNQEFLAHWVR